LSHEYIITLPVVSVCVMGGTVSGPNSLGIWTTGRRTGGSWRRKHLNSVRHTRALWRRISAPLWIGCTSMHAPDPMA